MVWTARVDSLTPAEFKRTYRMTLDTFEMHIRPAVARTHPEKGRRDLHGVVEPELQLSMTLRYLAGGSYLDIYHMHGVSRTAFYDTIPIVCNAIARAFPLHFPIDDPEALVRSRCMPAIWSMAVTVCLCACFTYMCAVCAPSLAP